MRLSGQTKIHSCQYLVTQESLLGINWVYSPFILYRAAGQLGLGLNPQGQTTEKRRVHDV